MPKEFRHFRFFFGQSITSDSIPICLSKKFPHWNNDSLLFVLEIIDNYIYWKNNILS